jgi:hypothetical protein
VTIDCDMYLSARDALRFVDPLKRDEAVLLFDDWRSLGLDARDLGGEAGVREVLREHPDLHANNLPSYRDAAGVVLVTRERSPAAAALPTTAGHG